MRNLVLLFSVLGLLGGFIAGCSSTTSGGAVGVDRRQLLLVSSGQVDEMSAKGYEEMKAEAKQKGLLDRDPEQLKRVTEISKRIIPQTAVYREDAPGWNWEVHVIKSDDLNAFCMPGGKIIFYSGIIEKLKLTDAEIAAIMGHEIAHALREHGRERISQQMLQQGGLQVLMATGKVDPKYGAAAGVVSTLLITLPYGRGQETEADRMGLELMARAGYNPEAGVTLWQKMSAAGGGGTPEWLSTHPSSGRRIADIQELIPKVRPFYQQSSRKN